MLQLHQSCFHILHFWLHVSRNISFFSEETLSFYNSHISFFFPACLQVPEDPENWNLDNGVYEQVVGEFTQNDIMDGKVFYRHVGPHRSDFLFDHIYFRLQDGGLPPNESDMKELIVKVRLWSLADSATVGETELIVKVVLLVFC